MKKEQLFSSFLISLISGGMVGLLLYPHIEVQPIIKVEELLYIQCQARGGKFIPRHNEPNPFRESLFSTTPYNVNASCEEIDYKETQCREAGGYVAVDSIFSKKYCKMECYKDYFDPIKNTIKMSTRDCSRPI